jgi:L-tartrate/succinate antiporter
VVLLRAVRRVVIVLILEPIPAAAVGLVGVTAATVSILVVQNRRTPSNRRSLDFRAAGSGSSSSPLCSPLGYEKTGLGRRVALNLVKWLGKRTLGLGYAVALADLTPPLLHPTPRAAVGRFVRSSKTFFSSPRQAAFM